MSENNRTCGCRTQQYSQIIFDKVAFQNGANTVYEATKADVAAATAGTRVAPNGNPVFKSGFERMQYLLGKQNRDSCGVAAKTFSLGTN
jgi:hypothetical protein